MLISSAIGAASPPDAGTNAKKKVVVGKKGAMREATKHRAREGEGEGTDGDDEDDYDVNVDAEERGVTRNP